MSVNSYFMIVNSYIQDLRCRCLCFYFHAAAGWSLCFILCGLLFMFARGKDLIIFFEPLLELCLILLRGDIQEESMRPGIR